MAHRLARTSTALLWVSFFLTSCGRPAESHRPDLPPPDLTLAPLSDPTLDVLSPPRLGPDAIFSGLRDRPSPLRDRPKSLPQRRPRTFQVGQEPDDSRDRATAIDLSGEIWGWIHPPLREDHGDVDWYAAEADLDSTRALTVELGAVDGCDLALELWHQGVSGSAKRVARVDAYGAGQAEQLGNVALTNGRWFLRVSSGKAASGYPWNIRDPYTLRIRVEDIDGGHELEPDDDERKANPVTPGIPMEATLHLGDEDWFRVDASQYGLDSRLALDILPDPTLGLRWEVITLDRVTVLRGEADKGQRVHVPNLGLAPGLEVFYVVVRAPDGLEGMARYTLGSTVLSLEGRTELEPNDSAPRALRVQVPATVTGWLHDPLDRDVYSVVSPSARAVRVDCDALPGVRPMFELMDSVGEVIGRVEAQEVGASLSLPNWSPNPEGGLIAISSAEGSSPLTPYSLAIQPRDTTGEEVEPNDSPDMASLVNPDQDGLRGYITFDGDRDCFSLPVGMVPDGGELEVNLLEYGDRMIRGTFYDPAGSPVDQVTVGKGADERVSLPPAPGGPSILCIEGVSPDGPPGRHGYRVKAIPVAPEPLEDGR